MESRFTTNCTKIWNENKLPEDWANSVFLPIPQKETFNNVMTVALISHSSKIFLKIIASTNQKKSEKDKQVLGQEEEQGTKFFI